jgi:shikimate kinase
VILIVGPKHCGKTRCAQALAALLGAPFVDLDAAVTQKTGKTPRALYIEGPLAWSTAEAEAFRDVLDGVNPHTKHTEKIAAAGGGFCDNGECLKLLREHPHVTTVFLELPSSLAWRRICRTSRKTGSLPPFLDGPDPKAANTALHERRCGAYRAMADLTIAAAGKNAKELAQEIAEWAVGSGQWAAIRLRRIAWEFAQAQTPRTAIEREEARSLSGVQARMS